MRTAQDLRAGLVNLDASAVDACLMSGVHVESRYNSFTPLGFAFLLADGIVDCHPMIQRFGYSRADELALLKPCIEMLILAGADIHAAWASLAEPVMPDTRAWIERVVEGLEEEKKRLLEMGKDLPDFIENSRI